jgi:hypothetical protein
MLEVTEAGSGTSAPMLVRANLRLRHLLFGSPTARVSLSSHHSHPVIHLTRGPDANLFKEAFIKAQQDNEKLFTAE